MDPTYDPQVFAVRDQQQAMRIILTPEGSTTAARWASETPFLVDLIGRAAKLTPDSVVLDYGCGIGRLARELIARFGCRVIGADISASMRSLAIGYVGSENFFACAPTMLDGLMKQGVAFDVVLSVWVLQHCPLPAEDIARLRRALKRAGTLFIVNNDNRAVPTMELGWVDDGLDIKAMLGHSFALEEEGRLPAEATAKAVAEGSFWAVYRSSRAALRRR